MLTVTKTSPSTYNFTGVIDESTDFDKLLSTTDMKLDIYCKDVTRINSVGIKHWREFFQKFRQRGGALRFFEISPALVLTVNYLSDFISVAEIKSFCAPFICQSCSQ